jgi:hypothetical protein
MTLQKWSVVCAVLGFTACAPEEFMAPSAEAAGSQASNAPCEDCAATGANAEPGATAEMGANAETASESLSFPFPIPIPNYTGPYILFYSTNNCNAPSPDALFGSAVIPAPLVDPSDPIIIPYGNISRFSVNGWKNDELRSMKIFNFPANTRIRVCDDSNCDTGDDWMDYRVKQTMPTGNGVCIGTFEPIRWYDPDYGWMSDMHDSSASMEVTKYYVNNLDGKVSVIAIERFN